MDKHSHLSNSIKNEALPNKHNQSSGEHLVLILDQTEKQDTRTSSNQIKSNRFKTPRKYNRTQSQALNQFTESPP